MLENTGLRTWAEVDYSKIEHNVREIEKLIGKTKIMGVVKADAYGHGALKSAKALKKAGVDHFAVACLDEAIELRNGGITEPVLILGFTAPERFSQLLDYDLTQTLISPEYGRELAAFGRENGPIKVHVKIDTGMNRTGILFEEQKQDQDGLLEMYGLEGLDIKGLFSHFPVSDDLNEESRTFTKRQIELFNEAVLLIEEAGYDPGLKHIQNSYGILNYFDLGMDYCRPGLLYMGVTSDDSVEIESSPDFIPIMSIKTLVSMVKTIEPGATVSYGRHFKAEKPVRVASLCIGYADGLPRACSNKNLEVIIRGQKAPIIGNICMDQCMADVTNIEGVQEGDIVTVVGVVGDQKTTMDEISRKAGTINNETMTRFTSRVPRVDVSGL